MTENTYRVERSLPMQASPARIYEQIADFHRWPSWSPWEDVDPELSRTYSGPESGTGAAYAWSGNRKAGKGRMQVTDASEPSRVQIELVFEKPLKANNDLVFSIESEGTGSRVTWVMTGRKNLALRAMGLFTSMEKLIGPDFERGLARLRATTEQSAAS